MHCDRSLPTGLLALLPPAPVSRVTQWSGMTQALTSWCTQVPSTEASLPQPCRGGTNALLGRPPEATALQGPGPAGALQAPPRLGSKWAALWRPPLGPSAVQHAFLLQCPKAERRGPPATFPVKNDVRIKEVRIFKRPVPPSGFPREQLSCHQRQDGGRGGLAVLAQHLPAPPPSLAPVAPKPHVCLRWVSRTGPCFS